MKTKPQAKDYPDEPILAFISERKWTTWFPENENSVTKVFPPGTPRKVVLAKMRSMIRRGLIDGCACGCRGDFRLKQ